MTSLFTACALLGGTLLICQTIMTLIGLSGDHDLGGDGDLAGADAEHGFVSGDHDHHGSTWFFGIVTFRTIVAATAFFGLAGMAAISNQVAEGSALAMASMAGLAAMYAVHWMMRQLSRLRADGSVRIERALGLTGNVYLRVPGGHQGAGKIHLNLQNRTVELTAWTDQVELPTGAAIVVTRIIGPDSVEVSAVTAKV